MFAILLCASNAAAEDLKSLYQLVGLQPWPFKQPPPFALKDIDGRTHRPQDYRDKVVIIYMFSQT